mmetsp:Transcript_10990/g.31036  ORF Transcript_10990/g.31036 Transcript_10990/m.31036 type:complete len:296 (+) Transcript_10990:592-1479(+)
MRLGPVHNETLMDLFKQQQQRGETGLSWGLHKDLMSTVAFQDDPYRFCAMAGRAELAAVLHARGVKHKGDTTAAYLTSAGVNGTTQWVKHLSFSPEELAMLAGHEQTARVLANIQRGIPLEWTRENHNEYPQSFKHQARGTLEALAGCSWFAGLPGTVRRAVVDLVMQDLASSMCWSMLPLDFWERDQADCLGPGLDMKTLDRILTARAHRKSAAARSALQAPQYHVRFAAGHAVAWRPWRWPRLVFRAATALAVVFAARKSGMRQLTGNIALGVAASNSASSALAIMILMNCLK